MLLSRAEFLMMNNPVRATIQHHYELPYLRRLGGEINGGLVLEVGCGRGRGVELIFDHLGAGAVHAFDLDPRMIDRARRRLASRGERVRLWVGTPPASRRRTLPTTQWWTSASSTTSRTGGRPWQRSSTRPHYRAERTPGNF